MAARGQPARGLVGSWACQLTGLPARGLALVSPVWECNSDKSFHWAVPNLCQRVAGLRLTCLLRSLQMRGPGGKGPIGCNNCRPSSDDGPSKECVYLFFIH